MKILENWTCDWSRKSWWPVTGDWSRNTSRWYYIKTTPAGNLIHGLLLVHHTAINPLELQTSWSI